MEGDSAGVDGEALPKDLGDDLVRWSDRTRGLLLPQFFPFPRFQTNRPA